MRCPKPRRISTNTCIRVCTRMGVYMITLIGGVVMMLAAFLLRRIHLVHGASHLIVGFWSFFCGLILVTVCSHQHPCLRPSQFPGLQRLLTWFSLFSIFALYVTTLTFLIIDLRNTGLASLKASIDGLLRDPHWIMKSRDEPEKSMWMLAYMDAMGIFVSFLSVLALSYPEDSWDTESNVTLNRVSVLSAGWVYEGNTPRTSMVEHDTEHNCSPKSSSCREAFRKFRFKQGPRTLSSARLLTQSPTEEESSSLYGLNVIEEESNQETSILKKSVNENQRENSSEFLVLGLPPKQYTLTLHDDEKVGSRAVSGRSPVEKLSSFKPFETPKNSSPEAGTTKIPMDMMKKSEEIEHQKKHLHVKTSSAVKSPFRIRKVWKLSSIKSRKRDRQHTEGEDTSLKSPGLSSIIASPVNGHYEFPLAFSNSSRYISESSALSLHQNHDHLNHPVSKPTPPYIPPRTDSRKHYSPPSCSKPELRRWTESGKWPTPSADVPDVVLEAPNSITASPVKPLQTNVDKPKRHRYLLEEGISGNGAEDYRADIEGDGQIPRKEVSFSPVVRVEEQGQDHNRPQKQQSPSPTKVKTNLTSSDNQEGYKNSVFEGVSSLGGGRPYLLPEQQPQQQRKQDTQVSQHRSLDLHRHSSPFDFHKELQERLKQRCSKRHFGSAEETKHPIEPEAHRASPAVRAASPAARPCRPQKPPRLHMRSDTSAGAPSTSPEGAPATDSSTSIGSLTRQVNEAFASILALQSSNTSSSRISNSPWQ